MKAYLPLLALCIALPALAVDSVTGEFSFPHEIVIFSYDEPGCAEAKGRWDGDMCIFAAEDTVTVSPNAEGTFNVAVDTVTTNAHTCGFEGTAKRVGAFELLASTPTEKYVPGQDEKDGKFVPATCELKLTYAPDLLSVSVEELDRASCENLCGMRADLGIDKAVRK